MKRAAALVGIPLLLALLWVSSESRSTNTAEVRITADRPTELRTSVIAALVGLGGVRVGEETSYSGRGSSKLAFDVPTARLEDALRSLDGLGGTVTSQRVDLTSAVDDSKRIDTSLGDVSDCLQRLGQGTTSETCRNALAGARKQLESSSVDLERSRLEVQVDPSGVSNPALIIAIALLCSAALGLGVMLWRSTRRPPDIDLTDFPDFGSDDELHLRRN
ncbi:MAG: hypothetical protein IT195_11875 [Microthrixaceae bacterium]|nr:hypothetical protein [Microthrixaceae bacterium]